MIVARFKEDDAWTKEITFPILIYNKHYAEYASLPNVGREANTYLHFIINNYEFLPELMLFCQGDPFQHSKMFVEKVHAVPQSFLGFLDFSDKVCVCDGSGGPHAGNHLPLSQFYTDVFGRPPLERYHFGPGAQFAVSRDRVLAHPLEFWVKLYMQTIDSNPGYLFGHIAERLWTYYFTPTETHHLYPLECDEKAILLSDTSQ